MEKNSNSVSKELARANRILSLPFDHPIFELYFGGPLIDPFAIACYPKALKRAIKRLKAIDNIRQER